MAFAARESSDRRYEPACRRRARDADGRGVQSHPPPRARCVPTSSRPRTARPPPTWRARARQESVPGVVLRQNAREIWQNPRGSHRPHSATGDPPEPPDWRQRRDHGACAQRFDPPFRAASRFAAAPPAYSSSSRCASAGQGETVDHGPDTCWRSGAMVPSLSGGLVVKIDTDEV